MIRWEYNTIEMDDTISAAIPHLDAAGVEGWEVIGMHVSAYGVTYLMKRPVPAPAPKEETNPLGVKHNHSIDRPCRASCEWFGTTQQLGWDNLLRG